LAAAVHIASEMKEEFWEDSEFGPTKSDYFGLKSLFFSDSSIPIDLRPHKVL